MPLTFEASFRLWKARFQRLHERKKRYSVLLFLLVRAHVT